MSNNFKEGFEHYLVAINHDINAIELVIGVDNWEGYEEAINDEEYAVTDDDLEEYPRMGIFECWSVNGGKDTWSEDGTRQQN